MALHSTGKQAHFPNYNNSLYNHGHIRPESLKLQYEAWTLKPAANLLPQLLHYNIITDMWLQAIHLFIKKIIACMTVLGSCYNALFTVWHTVRKLFASGWFGLWNVVWNPSKSENNNMLQAFSWELCYEKIQS